MVDLLDLFRGYIGFKFVEGCSINVMMSYCTPRPHASHISRRIYTTYKNIRRAPVHLFSLKNPFSMSVAHYASGTPGRARIIPSRRSRRWRTPALSCPIGSRIHETAWANRRGVRANARENETEDTEDTVSSQGEMRARVSFCQSRSIRVTSFRPIFSIGYYRVSDPPASS